MKSITIRHGWKADYSRRRGGGQFLNLMSENDVFSICMSPGDIFKLLLCVTGLHNWDTLEEIGGYAKAYIQHRYGYRICVTDGVINITEWSGKQIKYSLQGVDMNKLSRVLIGMLLETG